MNRRERRAARSKAKHRGIDPITALHEAGHAVGRYLVAPDMGIPEEKMITDIVVYSEGERPGAGTNIDGRVKFETLAVCNGPTLSAVLDAFVPVAREKLGLLGASTYSGQQAFDLMKGVLTAGRSKGIDVDAWVEARAIITVFGPMVEAAQRGMQFTDIWDGEQAEGDQRDIVGDGVAVGLSPDEISAVIDRAGDRVVDYLQQENVIDAVNALGRHLQRHGTTSGKRAAAIYSGMAPHRGSELRPSSAVRWRQVDIPPCLARRITERAPTTSNMRR